MSFPQLRVRTGMSFRGAYGRMDKVCDRIIELGGQVAAIVDSNTFGHVRFEKECKKKGVKPIYGMEIPIIQFDEAGEQLKFKPRAWILARDLKAFYQATSACVQKDGLTAEEFGALKGVLRFTGGALHALRHGQYDFIDVNPSSILLAWEGVQRRAEDVKLVAEYNSTYSLSTGDSPISQAAGLVLTSYNDMPSVDDKDFAYAWEVRDSVGMRTIEPVEVMWDVLKDVMNRDLFDSAVSNAHHIAHLLGEQTLNKAPMIHMEGDLTSLCRAGQASRLERGHIVEWTDAYEARLLEEISQIEMKDFQAYFFVVADLVQYAKKHMLVGPARGSAAGSLVCYVMGITEVDPMPYDLLFARFIDIGRADFPDIDIDFADTKRYMVFDYLREKYTEPNVCKLGNINTLQAASVMAQVGKKFGLAVFETGNVKNALITYSSGDERYGKGLQDTFDSTEPGSEFLRKRPEAARCMSDLELHPSHAGVHAAGILVCNDPITHYCTVNAEGVAQLDKPDSEYLNLLKIDALGLRTLGVIDDAGVTTAEELYALKMDDPLVLKILNDDKVSGIFQFEGDAVRSVTKAVNVDNFSKIDNLTALARPGPLSSGMAQKYIVRAAGKEAIEYDHPIMERFLGNTFGVFLYQEQIMQVVKEIGNFDWVKTSFIRKAISGRKGEEFFNQLRGEFVEGAISNGLEEKVASKIWNDMMTFGAWGFNKSHSVSYAIVTYWTLWMKCYHPLEFAAACLRSAKDDNQVISILRELKVEGVGYTPIDTEFSDLNWKVADGRLVGGILNAKGYGPVKALKYIEARAAGTLTEKQREHLANAEVAYADLAEAHTKFGQYYDNPRLIGVTSGKPILGMKHVKDGDDGLCIAKLTKKVLADENEPIRIKKRGGTIKKGPTQFVDLMMVDDSSDSPMRFRVRPENFLKFGKAIAEGAPTGSWFLVRGWKLRGLDMFIIKNIKRIDNNKE